MVNWDYGGIRDILVGGLIGNVPGAIYGGYRHYKYHNKAKKNLPKNSRNMDNNFRTPTRRRRRLSSGSVLFTPGSYRSTGSRRSLRIGTPFRRRRGVQRYRVNKRKFYRKNNKKMKRYRKKRVKKLVSVDKSHTHGYKARNETFGTVTDEHCVYMKHSSWNRPQLCTAICGALIRKLFRIGGIDLAELDQVVPGLGTAGAAATYRLLFWEYDPSTNGVTQRTFDTTGVSNLENMITGFTDLYNFFLAYLGNASNNEPHSMMLQIEDTTIAVAAYRTIASLNLQNEVMTMMVTSRLRYQNRTLAPLTGDQANQIEVVQNQPLSGRVINFKNADTRTKMAIASAPTNVPFNGIDEYGLELWGNSTVASYYQEPPVKGSFLNSTTSNSVLIGPGDTQQISVSYHYYGKMANVLKKFKPTRASLGKFHGLIGRSQLIALEETIRTDHANKIVVGYEREHTCSVWFTTKRRSFASMAFGVTGPTNFPVS